MAMMMIIIVFVVLLCSGWTTTSEAAHSTNSTQTTTRSKHSLSTESFLSSVESPHTRDNLQRAMTLLRSGRCEHVYLDVGTNVGVQIRKLFQPQHYPRADILPVFNEHFGTTTEDRKRVCAFGFEPNPHWSSRLREIESAYSRHGFPTVIFTETAAGIDNRNITFYMEPTERPDVHEWGASTLAWHKDMQPVTVGAISLAQFLNKEIHKRPGKTEKSKIVMKIDIEGAEFVVLPDLLLNHALCETNIVTCEFHERFVPDHPRNIPEFIHSINFLLRKTTNCTGQIVDLDDESYGTGQDTVPLPARLRHLRGFAKEEVVVSNLTYPRPSLEMSRRVLADFDRIKASVNINK